jgi:dTDP-glucose 4,6-dehydratase
MRTIGVTGGYGFIGSNFIPAWRSVFPDDKIVVFDRLTYAARPEYISGIEHKFELVDICDQLAISRALHKHKPDQMFHFAAESHVCRSITGPKDFILTNTLGTWTLLEEWRYLHGSDPEKGFYYISTDEVFGEIERGSDKIFTEYSQIQPRSPYAASKASADLIAFAYYHTYDLPVTVINCSNNFGPNQHEEKLIPQTIMRLLRDLPVRLYQPGDQIRDWLYVGDCCRAIIDIYLKGFTGERYVVGGEMPLMNTEIVRRIADRLQKKIDKKIHLKIDWQDARPKDDLKYEVDNTLIKTLGWSPDTAGFDKNLDTTIEHYMESEL